jgi:NADPH:quinone reductase-like Zn-dependent oxidoreductase
MRAMQIIEWGKPLEAREYADPEPQGEEVLLRVEAAGVCHSDVHVWDGHFDLGVDAQKRAHARQMGAVATIDNAAPDVSATITLPATAAGAMCDREPVAPMAI